MLRKDRPKIDIDNKRNDKKNLKGYMAIKRFVRCTKRPRGTRFG